MYKTENIMISWCFCNTSPTTLCRNRSV